MEGLVIAVAMAIGIYLLIVFAIVAVLAAIVWFIKEIIKKKKK